MARADDFNDIQTHIDSQNEPYIPYEYNEEKNDSWAGALPVKQ
jgi:glutamate synthase (NADPH/NADH)